MTSLEILAAILRGTHLAALISIFGTLVAIAMTKGSSSEALRLQRILRRLARISATCALIAGLAWLCTNQP